MHRRRFVATLATLAPVALAGCGSDAAPPPRKAEVYSDVELDDSTLVIDLVSDPEVESRVDEVGDASGSLAGDSGPAPVGVARAAKGGRGATGRGTGGYSSAPTGRHGWAVYYGGAYGDDWRDDHDDDVRMYDAEIATLAVAHLGTEAEYEDDPPGPGPVPWDETWEDPDEGTAESIDLSSMSSSVVSLGADWYRVGTELVATDGSTNFGWQCVDVLVEAGEDRSIDEVWHVRSRV